MDLQDDITLHFGPNLRYLRKKYNQSQEQLGNLLGLSRGQVASYENGGIVPPVAKILRIAQHFSVAVEALVSLPLSAGGLPSIAATHLAQAVPPLPAHLAAMQVSVRNSGLPAPIAWQKLGARQQKTCYAQLWELAWKLEEANTAQTSTIKELMHQKEVVQTVLNQLRAIK